mmetsp:Transcript_32320/g.83874  ORF Transcript_32320/g.83874 Transcript_32320/m.83874 type:complete len:157 (+) Transcript_32320:370-840(+)
MAPFCSASPRFIFGCGNSSCARSSQTVKWNELSNLRDRSCSLSLTRMSGTCCAVVQCTATQPTMLPQLEHAMGLLAFREASSSVFGETLSVAAREELADEVDEAILRFYDVQKEATLENILKHVKHVEAVLVEKACTIPRLDFSTASQAGIAFGSE